MATKTATIWLKEPVEGSLHRVSEAYTSKLDRSAMRAASGEQSPCGADHGPENLTFSVSAGQP